MTVNVRVARGIVFTVASLTLLVMGRAPAHAEPLAEVPAAAPMIEAQAPPAPEPTTGIISVALVMGGLPLLVGGLLLVHDNRRPRPEPRTMRRDGFIAMLRPSVWRVSA